MPMPKSVLVIFRYFDSVCVVYRVNKKILPTPFLPASREKITNRDIPQISMSL